MPPGPRRPALWASAALVAGAVAVAGVMAWNAWLDPGVAWLGARPGASWILYPTPVDTRARPLVELPTSFRKVLFVGGSPSTAHLRVRAFRKVDVLVNGRRALSRHDAGAWKETGHAEVAGLLIPGQNLVEAVVVNGAGPPALWLELDLPDARVSSDVSWEASLAGAAWRPARLAAEPQPGRSYDPEGLARPSLVAMRRKAPAVVGLLAAAATAVAAAVWLGRLLLARSADPLRAAMGFASLAWIALFVHDSGEALPLASGFDAPAHLDYIRYVMERRALPLANQGWQMFQPPLYYLLAAGSLWMAGLEVSSPQAVVVLRVLGLCIGLGHLATVAALLRLLLPRQPGLQVVGFATAALLPPMLYLHQFPTNEILAAALGGGVVFLAARLLAAEGPGTLRAHLALGVALGLALLAKFTALLLVPVVAGAVLVLALRGDEKGPRRLMPAAAACAAALLACGWHYGRVWARLGRPFVAGWEARPGLGWWLDPGYRTAEHFLRYGRVFSDPLFAGLGGFWDGLHSTMWGDGLLSGRAQARLPPWWSPDLHSIGMLLALLPAALGIAGGIATAGAFVRRRAPIDGTILAVAGLALAALALMTLRVPSVAEDKAFYGLLALGVFAVLVARGLEAASGTARWRRYLLATGVVLWALTSYATYWIDRSSPGTQVAAALLRAADGDPMGGIRGLRAGHLENPSDWRIRVALARLLLDAGEAGPEVEALLLPGQTTPGECARWVAVALWAERARGLPAALEAAERAVAVDPDDAEALTLRSILLERAGDRERGLESWREVLRVAPHDAEAHAALARLFAARGLPLEASVHRAWAAQLRR